MSLIGADEFLYTLAAYRVLWIRGRLGGGKTLLSVALADHLIRTHAATGAITNFPCALPRHEWRARDDHGRLLGVSGSVAIFDEAGLFLDRRTFARNDRAAGALLRKLKTYLLLPSVTPPDSRLSYFSVQRESANTLTGTWRYRWALAIPGAPIETGTFALTRPSEYFGRYATEYIPDSDGGYMRLWRATVAERGAAGLLEKLRAGDDDEEEESDASRDVE